MKDINEYMDNWYGLLDDLLDELKDDGYDILEANSEYITCAGDEDDVQYVLHLNGATRTIYITEIEVIEL